MNFQLPYKLRKSTVAVCTALGLIGSLAGTADVAFASSYTVQQTSPITVLPIDHAKFVAGQKFDFLIEVKGAKTNDIQVTIDGKSADRYFGKAATTGMENGIATYRIDQVSLSKAGNVEIAVTANGNKRVVSYSAVQDKAVRKAKNVILMIGDGMSLQAREMARILSKGITEGKYNDLLEMEKMPNMALVTTSGYDSIVTDSANSASAYATGNKAVVNAMGVYANSTPDPFDDPKVETIIELAKRTRGMATGLVTTANITDATPAAMFVHTRKRSEQNFIAENMLDDSHRPDVILGGGARQFLPMGIQGSKRKDNVDVVQQFKDKGYAFSATKSELAQTSTDAKQLLGLYQLDNMNVYIDREITKDKGVLGGFTDQPGLVDMTKKAIDTLSQNSNGFFLMAEGASIDKQLHTMDWQRATYDTIEFDKAVGVAREFAKKNKDTLVIVVADHAHGASITGTYDETGGKVGREAVGIYAGAGFPTFEDRNGDGYPDNPDPDVTLAVQYANHPDANMDYNFKRVPISPTVMVDGKAVANPEIKGEFYKGDIPVEESSEVHSADDVILNAEGPGAEYFKGVMDNTEVFFGMVQALGLDGTKQSK